MLIWQYRSWVIRRQKCLTQHELNQSENARFDDACGPNGANLTPAEKDRFSNYFHGLSDRQRMSFQEIVNAANEWRRDNGGGYRRSDRR